MRTFKFWTVAPAAVLALILAGCDLGLGPGEKPEPNPQPPPPTVLPYPSPSSLNCKAGETHKLQLLLKPDSAYEGPVTWTSENPTVLATKGTSGEVICQETGATRATARGKIGAEEFSQTVFVSVAAPATRTIRVAVFTAKGDRPSTDSITIAFSYKRPFPGGTFQARVRSGDSVVVSWEVSNELFNQLDSLTLTTSGTTNHYAKKQNFLRRPWSGYFMAVDNSFSGGTDLPSAANFGTPVNALEFRVVLWPREWLCTEGLCAGQVIPLPLATMYASAPESPQGLMGNRPFINAQGEIFAGSPPQRVCADRSYHNPTEAEEQEVREWVSSGNTKFGENRFVLATTNCQVLWEINDTLPTGKAGRVALKNGLPLVQLRNSPTISKEAQENVLLHELFGHVVGYGHMRSASNGGVESFMNAVNSAGVTVSDVGRDQGVKAVRLREKEVGHAISDRAAYNALPVSLAKAAHVEQGPSWCGTVHLH